MNIGKPEGEPIKVPEHEVFPEETEQPTPAPVEPDEEPVPA